jgi:hypothetical protein
LKPRVYNTIDIGAFEYWPVNVAPENILLSKTDINENSDPNSLVGVFSAVDQNSSDQHTYSFASDGGIHDVDNSSFAIVGDSLYILEQVEYNIKNTYDIYIETQDNGLDSLTYRKAFIISVSKVIDNIIGNEYIDAIELFPNPAENQLNILFNNNNSETSIIEIIDLKGTIFWKDKINSVTGQNLIKLDLSNYSNGIYLIKLINNDRVINYKLAIRH